MLRWIILALSRSKLVERIATHAPGLRGISRRFVAGNTQDDVIGAVKRLNADGFAATVSFLGEAVTSRAEVETAKAEFISYTKAIQHHGLRSHLSIKLSEVGVAFDRDLASRTLEEVLRAAGDAGTFVRIDMEDSRYTEGTLSLFREARARHDNVGIVVQAYLRRSEADIVELARAGAPVRLVKGAYREAEDVAYQAKADVDAAFLRLADAYFANVGPGGWLAIATHDGRMVREALDSARRHDIAAGRYEFQLLYGIRAEMQRSLRDAGHQVRIYVPYGSHWYPYMMRRLAERPANLWFFLPSAVR
jgi:proline dehydrogenase